MTLRVAINGFGRIGRNFLRAYFENEAVYKDAFDIVAVNDLGSLESLAHLLEFDTTHGRFFHTPKIVENNEEYGIKLAGKFIAVSHKENPAHCPWEKLNIDVVIESTGMFRAKSDAALHLMAGAKKVVIAAVAFDQVDATVVMGVNQSILDGNEKVISAASCTTHCIAPLLKILDERLQVESVFMTEMHAYTSDQCILDHVHRDLRRARAGAQNMIPTTSSSIAAVQDVLPEMLGKLAGYSMRVPINNVAAVDLCINVKKPSSIENINGLFAQNKSPSYIAVSELPLVSSDFNHRSESAIIDLTQTQVLASTVKLLVWYDNEWGYANRLLDLLVFLKRR